MTGSVDLSLPDDDRGVSELIGFVVVFGIIISSVGLLYMTGFQAMGDYQEHEQTKNAERAMDALAENFNDIVKNDGVRYRSGELALREGTISSSDMDTNLNVTGESTTEWVNASGSFVYEHEGTEIVYEGGAVIRSTDNIDWTVRNPPIRCADDDDVAIISLVELDGDGSSITAQGSQEVTAIQSGTETVRFTDNVSIFIDSPREEAFDRTLTASGWATGSGDGEYVCDTEEAVVRKTTINIEYT